jgi:hypothetical protein
MSCGNKLAVVVLCSSDEMAQNWQERGIHHPGLEITPIISALRAWQLMRDIVARHDGSVVVCQEHVWFGGEFASAVAGLAEDLDRDFPGWGVCGNRGCVWEGAALYDYTSYTRNQGAGIGAALRPRVVLSVDDNLVLLNCRALRRCKLVDLGATDSTIFGIPLSLECLRHHLPLFVDPRLLTVRTLQHSTAETAALAASAEFRNYYREHFLNHAVPWPDGDVNTEACVDYDYAARPADRPAQRDLLDLFELSLTEARPRRASLTLCCRTQFSRPELLWRALVSFGFAKNEARGYLDFEVRLVTDCNPALAAPHLESFRREFPALELECWHHTVRKPRHSRADLIFAALERAQTDSVWFVDDDDYVMPGAAQALARTLMPGDDVIVVGDSLKIEETWEVPKGEDRPALTDSRTTGTFSRHNLFRVLTGANHIPICSVLWPVRFMAAQLAARKALGDYNEDYFLLLAALSAPQAEVRLLDATIAGVSFRGSGNTVSETDRAAWHYSYTTFLQEILCEGASNPFLWQLGKAAYGAQNAKEAPKP